jgi:hypothetical protein
MTRLAATASHPRHGAPAAPRGPQLRIRRIGYAVLGLQLIGLFGWSTLLFGRFAGTWDLAQFVQSWTLIAHGHLDPFDTMHGFWFWQDHSAFLVWPLALLYWLWPHGVTLLWVQDVCIVAAEAVAFTWLCEAAQRQRPGRDASWLAVTGLIMLTVNPWTWWSAAWDFHVEALALPFAVLVLWDLFNGRKRAWVWVVPLLACGDVAGTYLAAAGLAALMSSRGARLRGLAMTCAGVAAVLVITIVHGNLGSGVSSYSYLAAAGPSDSQLGLAALIKGIALHPARVARVIWAKRLAVWAALAPAGLVGIGYLWVLPMGVIVLLANILDPGYTFTTPSFQYLPLYVLMPVGTVAALAWLARRHRRTAFLVGALLLAQAVAWAAVWLPRTPAQWLRVSAPAAATLARVQALIPASAEVVASQGVMGPFSGRVRMYSVFGLGSPLPVQQGENWFVITPVQGVETLNTASAMALIGKLAGLHAAVVIHANGVWALRWRPPPGVRAVTIPARLPPLPAWTGPGAAGRDVLTGPVAGWHVTSTGGEGYVADGLAWQEPTGSYQASVTLSAAGPVNVEVWDDTGNVLLARRSILATGAAESIVIPFHASTDYRAHAYTGWGPFRAYLTQPPPGQRLEVRVWSPGRETVNVYRAALSPG